MLVLSESIIFGLCISSLCSLFQVQWYIMMYYWCLLYTVLKRSTHVYPLYPSVLKHHKHGSKNPPLKSIEFIVVFPCFSMFFPLNLHFVWRLFIFFVNVPSLGDQDPTIERIVTPRLALTTAEYFACAAGFVEVSYPKLVDDYQFMGKFMFFFWYIT